MSALHALVVEDEPLARRSVVAELERRPQVDRVSEAAHGRAALELLQASDVDMLLLDVQMPEVSGLELLRRLPAERVPPVVFITAHEDFAVSAFEFRALDYLLKPFTPARFDEAFERLLGAIGDGSRRQASTAAPQDHLRIKLGGRTTLLPLAEILWIEAANSYVRIHTRGHTHLLRASLGGLERQLDRRHFLRVHRSAIVRLDAIRQLNHRVRGDYELVLTGGERVRATRRRRAELFAELKRRAL